MSDRPETPTTPTAEAEEEGRSRGITRWMMIGIGGLAGVIAVGFLIALIGSLADSEGVANFFRILRDFFIIVLALQGILICAALVILIVQVSALINLLSSEVKPIIDETRDTLSTARGTAEFVSQSVARPVIRTTSTLIGVGVFIRELLGIRRNLRGRR